MTDPSSVPALPPFYASPVPLELARHGSWRLLPGDLTFAANTSWVPLTVGEFIAACRCFPVLFSSGDLTPAAVMGLEGANLLIGDKGVAEAAGWAEGMYMPAYIRRYPFVLIEAPDKQSFALGIDAACDRVAQTGEEGEALFEGGQPTALTRQALEFCRLFNLDHQRTRLFTAALDQEGLLVDRQADIVLPDGRKLALGGFKVVDPEKLMALPDERVLAWHRAGWLALAYAHLASLDTFQNLLQRQARRTTEPSPKQDIEGLEPAPILQ